MDLRFNLLFVSICLFVLGCDNPITDEITAADIYVEVDSIPIENYTCENLTVNALDASLSNLNYIEWIPGGYGRNGFYWTSSNTTDQDYFSIEVPQFFDNSIVEYPAFIQIRANEVGQPKITGGAFARILIDSKGDVITIRFCEVEGSARIDFVNYEIKLSGHFEMPKSLNYE